MPKGENNRKLSDEQRAEIVRIYQTPAPDGTWTGVIEISRRFGVSKSAIQYALRISGVTMRTSKEAYAHSKRTKPIKNLPDVPAPPCKCGCGTPVKWNRRKNNWNLYVTGHYRKHQPFKDEQWLRHEYLDRERSIVEIARQFGVNVSAVRYYMKMFSIPARDGSSAHIGIQAGENNPAWRGGTTPERQRLYKSQGWKEMVRAILKRDNYTCARCGKYRKDGKLKLCTHHIKSWAEYPELRMEPSNLITLCVECHLWVHSVANINREFLSD